MITLQSLFYAYCILDLCYAVPILLPKLCITPLDSPEASCYIKDSSQNIIGKETSCKILYDMEGCPRNNEVQLAFLNETKTIIKKTKRSNLSSTIDISVPVSKRGWVIMLINGFASTNGKPRCIRTEFEKIASSIPVTLHASHLELPEGSYNLTVFHFSHNHSTLSRERKDLSFHDESLAGSVITRRSLTDVEPSSCEITLRYSYDEKSGVLRIYYVFQNGFCDEEFEMTLYEYSPPTTVNKSSCQEINNNTGEARNHTKFTGFKKTFAEKALKKGQVDFLNIPTGCYTIDTFGLSRYFWLESRSVTDMDAWNVTIYLSPRDFESSVQVRWEPVPAFNFTSWGLVLWYLEDKMVHCEGLRNEKDKVDVQKPKERTINTTSYTFKNLKVGYYCVRITPFDGRCPRDGCSPRSSRGVHLKAPVTPVPKEHNKPLWTVLVLAGAGALVVLIIVLSACAFFRKSFKQNQQEETCPSVPLLNYFVEPVPVLLIWTKRNVEKKKEFENVIRAFKNMLKAYSNCKVYDYLDYASLDSKDKQQLLKHPVEWLEAHLQNTEGKIIFVEPPSRKMEHRNGISANRSTQSEQLQGLEEFDLKLFPLVLRHLKESMELSSDYSRLFCVRFSDLYTPENELSDVVTWVRYTIPTHIKKLTLKLRGLDEDTNNSIQSLSEDQIEEFQSLIDKCKII